MISVTDYLMGRDQTYSIECTAEILENAAETVNRVNALLGRAAEDGVLPGTDQRTGTAVASGWRPAGINDRTRNSASGSRHITARACDLQDGAERALARWCLAHTEPACAALGNADVLAELGLWMEDPRWTGGADPWVHVQSVPPGSGRRVYVPSAVPPSAPALPEQEIA